MKFLIVAAKTGGHVFPAASVARELVKNNHEIVFLGTGSKIEKDAYKSVSSITYELSMVGFRGGNAIKKCTAISQVFLNIFKVLQIINKEKIDGMFGFGGFITVPAGIGCWLKRKPVFLHEQNAILGSANKLLSKISKLIFLGFPITGISKSVLSGNPIRESFIKNLENSIFFNKEDPIKIYITGGSQGAEYFNKQVPSIFEDFPLNIKIKHQCGQNNLSQVKDMYLSKSIEAEVTEFYENPSEQILWSNFVISRGGALSLSEIISLNRGAIIIPLPTSIDNHQFYNAKHIESMKMGIIHQQNESLENLKQILSNIIKNKTFVSWKENANKTNINSSTIIVNQVEQYFQINEAI